MLVQIEDQPEPNISTCINIYHPIGGVWVNISQLTEDRVRKYYTDGVLVCEQKLEKNGCVIANEEKKGQSTIVGAMR